LPSILMELANRLNELCCSEDPEHPEGQCIIFIDRYD